MKTILAVVLAVGFIGQVDARTIPLGKVSDSSPSMFFDAVKKDRSFSDVVSFRLTSFADISGTLLSTGIKNLTISLASSSFTETVKGGIGSYSLTDLAPGVYKFDITGLTGRRGGAYLSAFNVVPAVPEADTWLMIVIGAGLVGLQLRRKQKGIARGPVVAQ
jgi:PEP-CTERM motif